MAWKEQLKSQSFIVNSRRPGAYFFIWAIIMISAILLRSWGLQRFSLWGDELFSWWIASAADIRDIITITLSGAEPHPPLYHFGLRTAMALFGDSVSVLRGYSVAWGMAAMAAFWWLLKELKLDPAVQLWSMALLAVSGLQVHYAQEARMYSQALALFLFSLAGWTAYRNRNRLIFLLAACVSAVAAGLTNYLALGVFPLLFFFAFFSKIPSKRKIVTCAGLIISLAGIAPWYFSASFGPPDAPSYIMSGASFSFEKIKMLLASIPQIFIGVSLPRFIPPELNIINYIINLTGLFLLGGGSALAVAAGIRTDRSPRSVIFFLAIWFLIFWGGLAFLFVTQGFRWYARYLIFATPALLILSVLGFRTVFKSWSAIPLTVLLILGLLGSLSYLNDTGLRTPWREVMEELSETSENRKIVTMSGESRYLLYYAPELKDQAVEFPFLQTYAGISKRGHTYTKPEKFMLSSEVEKIIKNQEKLVVISSGPNLPIMDFFVQECLKEGYEISASEFYPESMTVSLVELTRKPK